MLRCIIDCPENIFECKSPDETMQTVYETAEATGLFAPNHIKVWLQAFRYFKLGADKKNFIHILFEPAWMF